MEWIQAEFGPADASPEDVIAQRLQRLLVADARLKNLFTADHIEAMPALVPFDARPLPRLQVAPALTSQLEELPSGMERRPVEVVVRIKFQASTWSPLCQGEPVKPWPYAEASLSTLQKHIVALLQRNRELVEVIDGAQVPLTDPGHFRAGPFDLLPTNAPSDLGDVLVLNYDLRFGYAPLVEHGTGLLWNAKP